MTSRGAYTLIELLIVLALFSLIIAIAVPNLGIINNLKEKQEFNELKRDLLYIRNKAITENGHYEINIDIKKNKYELGIKSNKSSVKSKTFKSGLKFVQAKETTANQLVFSPSGAPSQSGTFVIMKKNGDRYRFSIVSVSGKLNIYLIK